MSYNRPTIIQLMKQQSVDLSAQLNIPVAQVARSNAGVIAKVQAGGLHGIYGYLSYLIEQQFEDTADENYFARRASIRGIPKKLATKASGAAQVSGSDGAVITAGTILQRSDNERYIVSVGATITQGIAMVDIEAENPGSLANTPQGEELQFITPIAGVASQTVSDVIAGGENEENLESHRSRVLEQIREPPHGGNNSDYKQWAKATVGVSVGEVWPQSKWLGSGTVGVFFILENGDIPTEAQVLVVQTHVEQEAPVTADVYVMAPTESLVDISISGLTPDTATVRAAVTAELADLFIRSAVVENGTGNATVRLSHINEAISVAPGETDHTTVSPLSDVTFNKGEIPRLGEITWM
jgi:uncharacterized phage protein gp47/JayE